MVKTIKIQELPERKNNFKVMAEKFSSLENGKSLKLNTWIKDIKKSSELDKDFTNNNRRWNNFNGKYRKEFNKKIKLMEEIRESKINSRQVTWIYTPRYGYNKVMA